MGRIHNLRDFIAVLEQHGQLQRIKKPVSLQHELANVAATIQRQGRGASIFMAPEESPWPIFAGAVGSPELAALALECELADVTACMEYALDPVNAISPRSTADTVWKANKIIGDQVDLNKIPIPIHGAHDGGPFITGGITLAKDPISGRGNCSYNRMQVLGPQTLGFNVNEWRHVMQFYKFQEAKEEPLEIAIAIGVDPAISIAAGARYDDDELCIAGAMRGAGVPVSKGLTVDVMIPSEAEIVIEGRLIPHERRKEGPWLNSTVIMVSYGRALFSKCPPFVTAITPFTRRSFQVTMNISISVMCYLESRCCYGLSSTSAKM